MNRSLVYVVGLGPGGAQYLTAQAQCALQAADVLCGYTVYIDLVRPLYPDKEVYATGMTRELDRCRWALETAQTGKTVALVCSGDAGVYGMASPLLELAEHCPEVEVEIVPGLTAALSGAAVLGAPLAHDFCVISLSDRLTPWAV
ncbi:MAG: SAM-dependent methyltransferase, partial [Gemmiger formicilis]|uniref:SAM-dependent methyltransferase n=2 Tax=Eubacteriales incertae sedis TaxID=538999 RepID=UPI003A3FE381